MIFLRILIEIAILGFIAWVVNRAPIIEQPFKSFIVYGLLVIAAVILIGFLLGITGPGNIVI